MKSTLVIVLFFVYSWIAYTQENEDYYISKASSEIELDGILDEQAWKDCQVLSNFVQQLPYDTSLAETKTEVFLTYSDAGLYVGVICYDNRPDKSYTIQSLKRDFSFPASDAFQFSIDPYGDLTNGFAFGINPYGVQREGMLSGGGSFGVSTDWDCKWYSRAKILEGKWQAEMFIPFKSIRFKEGVCNWKMNFARNNYKINETSVWSPVPRNFNVAALAFCGDLKWDEEVNKSGTNVSIIPYVSGAVTEDFSDPDGTQYKANAGFDAKIGITSSLNLDLTVNPDFSQVEVDNQVTNISRFSLFFPEKRQFFIENSDLFGNMGFRKIRPFFSRRIGIAFNPTTGIYEQQPILGGARLSGKLNKDWRLGALNMTTPFNRGISQPTQNYSVLVLQRQVLTNSNITAFIVNRQALSTDSTGDFYYHPTNFNRVIGADFNYASKDNKFIGKAFIHQSIDAKNPGRQGTNATFFLYNTQNWRLMWNHEYVGRNYNAEVGFVPRLGVYRLEPEITYRFYPKSNKIISHNFSIYEDAYLSDSLQLIDAFTQFNYNINFFNTSGLELKARNIYTLLRFDFDPSGKDSVPLLEGTEYSNNQFAIWYGSDQRKKFTYSFYAEGGSYFNGEIYRVNPGFSYRFQPYGSFGLGLDQTEIRLPDPYLDASWTVFGPKVELTLTNSLFFNLFVQYNSQANNVNVNSRLQWRFAPLSDLFIVYTDNYYAESDFSSLSNPDFMINGKKNRALVIKLLYWFSV